MQKIVDQARKRGITDSEIREMFEIIMEEK